MLGYAVALAHGIDRIRHAGGWLGALTMSILGRRRRLPASQAGGLTRTTWIRLILVDIPILAGMASTVAVHTGTGHAVLPNGLLLAFTLLAWLPLLARVRWPLAALAAVLAVECTHIAVLAPPTAHATADTLMGFYQPTPIAAIVAAFSVAYRTRGRIAWTAGGAAAILLPLIGLITQPLSLLATDVVMFNLVLGTTLIGWAIREQQERKARDVEQRRAETRRQVIAERVRIARELHDSLAHDLALVNAQVGVASHLVIANPEAAAKALKDITQHTRQALDDLKATVGLLRQDDDGTPPPPGDAPTNPAPGLHRLDDLLAGFHTAGTTVDLALTVTGTAAPLSPSVDLTAYRIVQEALTNATKHAAGAPVRVNLDWSARQLDINISNSPAAGHRHSGPGTGTGLIGMRERTRYVGGTLHAGHTPDGGYRVTASLPIDPLPHDTQLAARPGTPPGATRRTALVRHRW